VDSFSCVRSQDPFLSFSLSLLGTPASVWCIHVPLWSVPPYYVFCCRFVLQIRNSSLPWTALIFLLGCGHLFPPIMIPRILTLDWRNVLRITILWHPPPQYFHSSTFLNPQNTPLTLIASGPPPPPEYWLFSCYFSFFLLLSLSPFAFASCWFPIVTGGFTFISYAFFFHLKLTFQTPPVTLTDFSPLPFRSAIRLVFWTSLPLRCPPPFFVACLSWLPFPPFPVFCYGSYISFQVVGVLDRPSPPPLAGFFCAFSSWRVPTFFFELPLSFSPLLHSSFPHPVFGDEFMIKDTPLFFLLFYGHDLPSQCPPLHVFLYPLFSRGLVVDEKVRSLVVLSASLFCSYLAVSIPLHRCWPFFLFAF